MECDGVDERDHERQSTADLFGCKVKKQHAVCFPVVMLRAKQVRVALRKVVACRYEQARLCAIRDVH